MVGFLLPSIAHPDRMRGIRYLLVREDEILGLIVRTSKGLGKRGLNFSCSPDLRAVLRQNKRGQRRGQALMFAKSLLIRWRLGERRELWDEAKGRVVALRKDRTEKLRRVIVRGCTLM